MTVFRTDPMSVFNFYLTLIDSSTAWHADLGRPHAVAGFTECTGLEATMEAGLQGRRGQRLQQVSTRQFRQHHPQRGVISPSDEPCRGIRILCRIGKAQRRPHRAWMKAARRPKSEVGRGILLAGGPPQRDPEQCRHRIAGNRPRGLLLEGKRMSGAKATTGRFMRCLPSWSSLSRSGAFKAGGSQENVAIVPSTCGRNNGIRPSTSATRP